MPKSFKTKSFTEVVAMIKIAQEEADIFYEGMMFQGRFVLEKTFSGVRGDDEGGADIIRSLAGKLLLSEIKNFKTRSKVSCVPIEWNLVVPG